MNLSLDRALHALLAFKPDQRVPVGRLAIDGGVAVFEYAPEFVASGLQLNPMLETPAARVPLRPNDPSAFEGLHGMFADSLPDAWGRILIDRRVAMLGMIPANLSPLDVLSIVGSRGMGALEYRPESVLDNADVSELDLDVLAHEAAAVIAGKDTDVLPQTEALGGSSGGARPKVLVAINKAGHMMAGANAIPDGYDAWLVKFRSGAVDIDDIGPLECAYADMAKAAGIAMTQTRLIESRTSPGYFATRRFDRAPGNQRLHVLSVSGMLETPWRIPTIHYGTLLALTQRVTADARAVEQIVRRMTFNVFAHNRDDHAKQHAFLMDSAGGWTLAPAYDLTFSRGPGGQHYLDVDGRGYEIRRADVLALANQYIRRRERAEHIVDEVIATVGDFRRFADCNGVSARTAATVWQAIEEQLTLV